MPTKEEKKLSSILTDIEVGLLYQKEDQWLESCRRWLGYIDNKYPVECDTPYVVNTFLSLINLIVPTLYYNDPVMMVSCNKDTIVVTKNRELPLHIPGYLAASLQQDILNAIYPRLKIGNEFKLGVQDALIYGLAAFKTGITTKTESDKEYPTLPKKTVYVSCICPEDVIYDPMATGSFDSCAFVAHRYVKELSLLKQDDSLKNLDKVEGSTIIDNTPKGDLYKSVKRKSLRKYVTLYEYHDQNNNKISLVAHDPCIGKQDSKSKSNTAPSNTSLILKEWDKDKSYNGSDFTLLRFSTINNRIRGVSLIGTQEDEALAINQVFTLQIRHLNMFGGIFVYERGSLTEEQLLAWQSSRQGDMLEVEPNVIGQGRVRRESPLQMGAEYFNAISSFTQLIDRTVGIPDFQQIYSTKRKTATESAFEQGDTRVRRDFLLSSVKEAIIEVSQKIMSLIHKHYSIQDIEELVGYPVPKDLWEAVSDMELYQLDVDVESMIVYNQSMATGLMQSINYLASNPVTQPELMKLDGSKIAARIMKGFGTDIKYLYREDEPIREEQNPERENDSIQDGAVIPSPQPFEPHADHLAKHQQLYVSLMNEGKTAHAQRLMDHMQLHAFYQQSLQQVVNPQQGLTAQGQGTPLPLNNPASDPMMSAQPEPTPSEAELVGNFRG